MITTAAENIVREVATWPGVTQRQNERGGLELSVGKVELGHLHGNAAAHIPFPRALRDELLSEARVTPHPIFPKAGWAERQIVSDGDVADVIALFRLNYDRVAASRPTTAASTMSKGNKQS